MALRHILNYFNLRTIPRGTNPRQKNTQEWIVFMEKL